LATGTEPIVVTDYRERTGGGGMHVIARSVVAMIAALTLAACGGDDTGADAGGGGGGGGGAPSLSMVDNAFEPADLTVSSGATVEVSNDGQNPHTITIEEAGIDEEVEPGQSTSITIDVEAGEYTMICRFHESVGMEGTITIE
jgi:plastocyanin